MFVAKRIFFAHDETAGQSIMLNSVSGACDLLPVTLAKALEQCRGQELSAQIANTLGDEVQTLQDRGYLFVSPEDEEVSLQHLYNLTQERLSKLTKFVICPTYMCNLACTYCYEGDLTRQNSSMPVEHIQLAIQAIDIIKQRPEVKSYLYELFGGEPLLPTTYNFVVELLSQLSQRSETIAIVTNGTHIGHFIEVFKQYHKAIESFQITIDGPKKIHDQRRVDHAGHGSFDRIVHGVDQLLKEGFFVRIRVNVDRQNIKFLPDFFDFIERREWTTYRHFSCDIAPVTHHTQHVKYDHIMEEAEVIRTIITDIPELLHPQKYCNMGMFRVLNHITSVLEPKRRNKKTIPSFTYCEAAEGSIYVFGADGAIYSCPDAIIDRKWAIGEYAPKFWLEEEKIHVWQRDILSIPQCRQCEIATFCGGGCALVSFDQGVQVPNCNGAHETLRNYLSLWLDRQSRTAC